MILLSSSIHRRWVLHPLIQDEYQDWRLLIWQSNSPQLQSFFGSKSMENNILWLFCCFRVNGEDVATSSWRLNAANTRKWRWLEFSVIKLLRAKNPISRGESNDSAASCLFYHQYFHSAIFSNSVVKMMPGDIGSTLEALWPLVAPRCGDGQNTISAFESPTICRWPR